MNTQRWQIVVEPTTKEAGAAIFAGQMQYCTLYRRIWVTLIEIYIALASSILMVVLLGGLLLNQGVVDRNTFLVFVPVLVFLGILLMQLKHKNTLKWLANLTVKSRFGQHQDIQISQDALIVRSQNSEWRIGWGDVEAVKRKGKVMVAVVGGNFIVLPERCFVSKDDAEAAFEAMQAWVFGSKESGIWA